MKYVLGYFGGLFGALAVFAVGYVVWRVRLARRYSSGRAVKAAAAKVTAAKATAASVSADDETGWC